MKTNLEGAKLILEIETDITASQVQDFLDEVKHASNNFKFETLVMDLGKVKQIDSIGITFVIKVYKMIVEDGKELEIIRVNEQIYQVLKLIKLTDIIKIVRA